VDEQALILVIEDDEATRGFLADNLAADGILVSGTAANPSTPGATSTASARATGGAARVS
jgi:DNA-binding response OmpR family regulator